MTAPRHAWADADPILAEVTPRAVAIQNQTRQVEVNYRPAGAPPTAWEGTVTVAADEHGIVVTAWAHDGLRAIAHDLGGFRRGLVIPYPETFPAPGWDRDVRPALLAAIRTAARAAANAAGEAHHDVAANAA